MAETYDETRARLDPAFEAVQNAEHWKGAIDATMTIEETEKVGGTTTIREAVEFFTATCATFEFGIGNVRITALGYWGGPAA